MSDRAVGTAAVSAQDRAALSALGSAVTGHSRFMSSAPVPAPAASAAAAPVHDKPISDTASTPSPSSPSPAALPDGSYPLTLEKPLAKSFFRRLAAKIDTKFKDSASQIRFCE